MGINAQKVKKVTKRIILLLFILSLIALYIVIYAIPGVTGVLTQTEILQYGNFRVEDDVICYFLRNETVYVASRAGNINYYIGDAVQVKAGTRILNITQGPQEEDEESEFTEIMARLGDGGVMLTDFVSEFNGMTSYFIDGYENYFTLETMWDLRYDRVSRRDYTTVNVVRERAIRGEPLYKICDNREWYIICWVDTGNVSNYERGRNVTIELPLGDIRAEILDIVEDGAKWMIIFKTNRYYEDFARVRSVPATVVTSNFNGVIIRNESIAVEDGTIGVYVRTRAGTFAFRPIRIITSDGRNSLVEVSFFEEVEIVVEDGVEVEVRRRVPTVNVFDEIQRRPQDTSGE